MSLRRDVGNIGYFGEKKLINVWDITTKKIVFVGDRNDVARFININNRDVSRYINEKIVRSKKYTLRVRSEK